MRTKWICKHVVRISYYVIINKIRKRIEAIEVPLYEEHGFIVTSRTDYYE